MAGADTESTSTQGTSVGEAKPPERIAKHAADRDGSNMPDLESERSAFS